MSDIQAVIELIEEGRNSNEYGDGWGQVSTALAMLRKMQEDSHLHSGQRWELSQILECGPLYGDIEKAVKEMKEQHLGYPIETAPKDGTRIIGLCGDHWDFCYWEHKAAYGYVWMTDSCADFGGYETPTRWIPEPKIPNESHCHIAQRD